MEINDEINEDKVKLYFYPWIRISETEILLSWTVLYERKENNDYNRWITILQLRQELLIFFSGSQNGLI